MTFNEANTFDKALMQEIRERFACVESDPFSGKRVYFENAGGTLRLESTLDAVGALTSLPDNSGRRNAASRAFDAAIAQGRCDVALLLGASSGQIIADQSTTGMLFRVVGAVAGAVKGKNIVTTNLDHAASFDANRLIARRHGLEFRFAELDAETGVVPVESILERVNPETVCLTVVHTSNILGSQNDVAEIVKQVRRVKSDMFIVLDGAQKASHGRIDVERYGADAWIFVPYKMYSKIGTSFAWVSQRLADLPHENLLGAPKDFWDLGTREAAAYACMSKVAEYFRWLGGHFTGSDEPRAQIEAAMDAMERHEAALLSALLYGVDQAAGLTQMEHVRIYGKTANIGAQTPIVAFNVAGKDSSTMVDYFERNGVRLGNRLSNAYSKHTLSALGVEECLRISLCHYNTIEEVEIFLKLLERVPK